MKFLGKIDQIIGWRSLSRVDEPSGKSWIRHLIGGQKPDDIFIVRKVNHKEEWLYTK